MNNPLKNLKQGTFIHCTITSGRCIAGQVYTFVRYNSCDDNYLYVMDDDYMHHHVSKFSLYTYTNKGNKLIV